MSKPGKTDKGNGVPTGFAKVDITVKVKADAAPSFSINPRTFAASLNREAAKLLDSLSVNVYYNKNTGEVLLEKNGDITLNKRMITIGKGANKGQKREAGVSIPLGTIIKGYDLAKTMKKHGTVKAHDLGVVFKIN